MNWDCGGKIKEISLILDGEFNVLDLKMWLIFNVIALKLNLEKSTILRNEPDPGRGFT